MDELRDLYQEVILDHYKKPRNFGALPGADHKAQGDNPICGDRLTVFVRMDGDRIADLRFDGGGCAISTASASIMTEMVKGKTLSQAHEIFHRFHELVTGTSDAAAEGKLAVFAGVREFPVRVKCATLAWHTLMAALKDEKETVTTE